jgi:hypothetical protein
MKSSYGPKFLFIILLSLSTLVSAQTDSVETYIDNTISLTPTTDPSKKVDGIKGRTLFKMLNNRIRRVEKLTADTARLPYRYLSWFGNESDTSAFIRAVQYCTAKNLKLRVSEGTWLCGSVTIYLDKYRLDIEGDNDNTCILKQAAGTLNGLLRIYSSTNQRTNINGNISLKRIKIDFNGANVNNSGEGITYAAQ